LIYSIYTLHNFLKTSYFRPKIIKYPKTPLLLPKILYLKKLSVLHE